MRQVEQKPAIAGIVGTVFVWILIFLFFYFGAIIFAPKQYKTIKIRLDSPSKTESPVKKTESEKKKTEQVAKESVPQKTETAVQENKTSADAASKASAKESAPAPAPAPKKIEQKPAAKKADSTPKVEPKKAEAKKAEPKKTEPKKTQPQPAPTKKTEKAPVEKPKMVEQQLQKSMDELLAEQQQQKKAPKKEFDWSQFDDIEGTSSSSSNSNAVAKSNHAPQTAQNAFSGSAASSSNAGQTPVSSTSKSERSSANQTASASTQAALAGAVSAKKYSSSSGGVDSSVTANTGKSSDGKVSLQMADGTPRVLLEPSEPKIVLSKEAAALIDSTKRLTVSFTVTANGNVPVTSVKISPDILPSIVAMEIREQISRWRFQSASYDGTARFEYTIKKN